MVDEFIIIIYQIQIFYLM